MNHEIRQNVDHVHSSHFERADGLVLKLSPENQHRYHAAIGLMDGRKAVASGLSQDGQRAHDELLAIESEENTRHAILRAQRATMTDDEQQRFDGRKERQKRKIEALNSATADAIKESSGARDVANRTVLYVSGVAADGGVLTPKTVKLGRGPYEEQLATNREEQHSLRQEYERIRNAGTPVPVLKEQLHRALDARKGRDPFALSYFDGEVKPKEPVLSIDAEPLLPGRIVTAPDLLPLMLELFGNEIEGRLLARIDRDHEGDNSLRIEAGEKRRLLADLRSRVLELQYVEGALLTAMAGPDALEIPFRRGMDPRAVLGVTGPAPKPV